MNWTKKEKAIKEIEKEKKKKEINEEYKKMMDDLNIEIL